MVVAPTLVDELPPGYAWLDDEPAFDPAIHLDLTMPERIDTLADFGYSTDEIEPTATPVAATSAFRILSDEGAAVFLDTCRRLKQFAAEPNERIQVMVRQTVYRSKFMRDLCVSPEVTAHMSTIYGVPVASHTMGSHLGHLNFAPLDLERPVDKWHHDTLALDYVMCVSDPAQQDGGDFEYFHGTKAEAAAFAEAGETPPRDRVVVVEWPGPGYAVALHGNMVVHRGGPVHSPCERITMVNGYVALDTTKDDQTRSHDLVAIDPAVPLFHEWGRHAAWRGASRLQAVIDELEFEADPAVVAAKLQDAVAEVNEAVEQMTTGNAELFHYEKAAR